MIKVVVIDGNAISRNLLTTLLVNGGYELVGDGNASPASLAALGKLKPQVVCIDLGEGGMELLDSVREVMPKALVFLVSAKVDADTVQAAAQRHVSGFIVKPFKGDTVLNTIRNAIIKLARQHRSGPEE